MNDETGWLIELDAPGTPTYWAAWHWTTDSLMAIRFARRIDAERVAESIVISRPSKVTEHMWCAATA